jgi:phosphatidate cytidylyltransferase
MLRQRVLTAIVLVAAFLAALFLLPPAGWTALAAVVLAVAAWEWAGFAAAPSGARIAYAAVMTVVGLLAAASMQIASGALGPAAVLGPIYAIALVFWLLGATAWLRRRPAHPPRGLVLLAGWIVLIPTFLALVQLRNIHPVTLLAFMMLVWIADIAAYFTGRAFGRHKLAPHVSPGKTWEGFAGALVATGVYGLVWYLVAPQHSPAIVRDLPGTALWMVLLALALAALSVIGDLLESAMKRQAGLKDSGTILPGHGGVMDRIDALTPVLPAAALVSML